MDGPALLSGTLGQALALLSCAIVAALASRFVAARLGRTPKARSTIAWVGFALLFLGLAALVVIGR